MMRKESFLLVLLALVLFSGQVMAAGFGTPTIDGTLDAVYGTAEATDKSGDGNGNAVMDLLNLYVCNDVNYWYFYFTINADINATRWGKYLIYMDTDSTNGSGATSDAWGRNVVVSDPHKPEYSIASWVDGLPYDAGDTQVWKWMGSSWSLTGTVSGAALSYGTTSAIEWKIAKATLGSPTRIWCEVWSTGGGTTDNAQDTSNDPAEDWNATNWSTTAILLCSTAVPEMAGGDITPPTLVSVSYQRPGPSASIAIATFSEPVDKTTAETPSNYTIPGVNVVSATRSGTDSSVVTLGCIGALSYGTCHQLTVINVKDTAGNPIVNNGVTNVACAFLSQLLVRGHMALHLSTSHPGGNPSPPDTFALEGSITPLTWDPTCDYFMVDPDADSIFVATVDFSLPCTCSTGGGGARLEFKFTHDCGEWESISNHVYDISTATVIDTIDIWWNDLAPANYTTKPIDVVFKVDMSAISPAPGDTVALNGSQNPLNWNVPSTRELKDDGVSPDQVAGDKIYTGKVRFPKTTFATVEYKYVHGLNYECFSQGNRSVYLNDAIYDTLNPLILPIDVWDRCTVTRQDVKVIFRVNTWTMWPPVGPSDTVSVNGSVSPLDWNVPSVTVLKDDGVAPDSLAGDKIYTAAVIFPDSSSFSVDYKYLIGTGYECVGYGNRTFGIDDVKYSIAHPETLAVDLWNYCGVTIGRGAEGLIDSREPLSLYQNYPNPLFGSTNFEFTLPKPGHVSLRVFNAAGRLVRTLVNEPLSQGRHSISWDGKDAAMKSVGSGVYFVELSYAGESKVRRMIVLK
ncbi:MAG: FlgD immunoglobulin-like domain containing protein [Candidatus Eisenbacteria bacterium]|nr:FlgD immunoglobulin-like domain containing protein [Candidatus Eisenbacteria bacterium]